MHFSFIALKIDWSFSLWSSLNKPWNWAFQQAKCMWNFTWSNNELLKFPGLPGVLHSIYSGEFLRFWQNTRNKKGQQTVWHSACNWHDCSQLPRDLYLKVACTIPPLTHPHAHPQAYNHQFTYIRMITPPMETIAHLLPRSVQQRPMELSLYM